MRRERILRIATLRYIRRGLPLPLTIVSELMAFGLIVSEL
jgi:hypothetical protein